MPWSHPFPPVLVALSFAAATAQAPAPSPPARQLVDGLVFDVLGDPIPAAAVRAERDGTVVARSTCDGDGRFRLRLPELGAELVIQARGKAAVRVPWRGATRSPVERIVLEDGADLRGRVFDAAGQAVAGAHVLVAGPGFRANTTTAADGSYHLLALPLRGLNLFASSAAGRTVHRLRLIADATVDVSIAGTVGRALVQLSDLPPDRLATANARVFGCDIAAVIDGGRVALRPDATAEFGLRDTCLVTLEAPGYHTTPRASWLSPDSKTDLRAVPANLATITGSLQATNGKAVPGMQVVVRDRSGMQLLSAITDDGGQFRATASLPMHLLEQAGPRIGIRLGEGLLIADSERQFKDGHCWAWCDLRAPIHLKVEPAARVRQRLSNDQGQALAFAEVVVVDNEDDAYHRPLLTSCTDGDGRLELDLPPCSLRMLAISPHGAVMTANWQADTKTSAPVWRPVRCGNVEGVLLDGAGAPVPGVEILVASVDLQVGGNDAAVRQRAVVRTDRLGRFRCRGLPIGEWTLATLDFDEPANAAFAATEGETTKVDLRFAR